MILRIIAYLLCGLLFLDLLRLLYLMGYAGSMDASIASFESRKNNSMLNLLFLGDSVIYGQGASKSENTIPGLFAKKYPKANIANIATNGGTAKQWAKSFSAANLGNYDAAIVSIGGNDILSFQSNKDIERNIRIVVEKALQVSSKVIIVHSEDVGNTPFYSFWFSWYFKMRVQQLLATYERIADNGKVVLVFINKENAKEYYENPKKYFAPNYLHPNDEGYKVWFKLIDGKIPQP